MANSPLDVLMSYEQKLIDALVQSLEKNDRVKGGSLAQSVSVRFKAFATHFTIEIDMEKYWKFVDKGVDGWSKSQGSEYKYKKGGKPIPEDAMREFMAENGITPAMSISRQRQLEKVKGKGKLSGKIRKGLKQKNKSDALRSAGYAMGFNIKKKGIKPTHFVDEALDGNIFDQLTNDMAEALGREITITLDLKNK